MSDSSFAFEAPEAGFEDETESGSRRNLLLAGGLAVVLAAGGFFLLAGGGEEEDFSVVPSARPAVAPAAPVQEAVLPVESQIQLGRNPFKPLYIAPADAPAAEAPVDPAASVAPTTPPPPQVVFVPIGGGSPTTAPAPAPAPTRTTTPTRPAPTQPAPSPTATTPPPAPEYTLRLAEVYGEGDERTALFLIEGEQMSAKVGNIFGPTAEIRLVALTQSGTGAWTATLQVGDGDPFDVATGETVYVR